MLYRKEPTAQLLWLVNAVQPSSPPPHPFWRLGAKITVETVQIHYIINYCINKWEQKIFQQNLFYLIE